MFATFTSDFRTARSKAVLLLLFLFLVWIWNAVLSFLAALWSPAGKGLTSLLTCLWCFRVYRHLSIWCPRSGMVLDSWYLPSLSSLLCDVISHCRYSNEIWHVASFVIVPGLMIRVWIEKYISQPKHILWLHVLKRTVSMRRFFIETVFRAHKTHV